MALPRAFSAHEKTPCESPNVKSQRQCGGGDSCAGEGGSANARTWRRRFSPDYIPSLFYIKTAQKGRMFVAQRRPCVARTKDTKIRRKFGRERMMHDVNGRKLDAEGTFSAFFRFRERGNDLQQWSKYDIIFLSNVCRSEADGEMRFLPAETALVRLAAR